MTPEKKHKIIRTVFVSFIFVLFGYTFYPFLTELLLAALFAFALHDLIVKITKKNFKRHHASLAVTLGVLIFIAAPIVFVTLSTISAVKEYAAAGFQNTELYQSTLKILHDVTGSLSTLVQRFGINASNLPNPTDLLSKYSGNIGTYATNIVTKLPDIGLSLFVFFLALFYFLNESKKIKEQFLKFDLLSADETNKIIGILKKSSYLTLVISILIAVIQAFTIATVAYFCGFTEFVIIFVVTSIFSLVPVVGTAPVPIILMLVAYVQGNTGAAVAMMIAGLAAGGIDNIVKPMLLSSSGEDLPPIISLLTLIGAILVYGAVGILIGPIITQLVLNILDIFRPGEKSSEIVADSDL